jgi:hypothetical protein
MLALVPPHPDHRDEECHQGRAEERHHRTGSNDGEGLIHLGHELILSHRFLLPSRQRAMVLNCVRPVQRPLITTLTFL